MEGGASPHLRTLARIPGTLGCLLPDVWPSESGNLRNVQTFDRILKCEGNFTDVMLRYVMCCETKM